jgi:hypothetical protein
MFENVLKSLKALKDKAASAISSDRDTPDFSETFKPQRVSRLIDIIQPGPLSGPTPEEVCGVTPAMDHSQVKARLALLYRRYNRAASSLDPKLRHEAERMLDAIVTVREKILGPI